MEFFVLGPVEVWHAGVQVPLGRRRTERCLLGLLLLEAGHVVSIDRLADLLWDGNPRETARSSIQGHVSRLRSVLDPGRDGRLGVRLVAYGDGYVIRLGRNSVDAQRFKTLASEASQVAQPSRRAQALRQALALWRGPVLADVASDRMRDRVGTSLMEFRLQCWEGCFEAELEAGRHREIIAEILDLVEKNPGRERLIHSLMLAFYRDGRQADALQLFRQVRGRAADSTGLDVSGKLSRLHDAILREDPDLGLASSMRETVSGHQIVPAQLPNAVPDFTGRAAALKRLDELADAVAEAPLVVTIAGTAGVGKTALAVQWGHDSAWRFPEGQLHFNLRGHGAGEPATPIEVLTAFLRASGVAPPDVPGSLEEAEALYRTMTAGKRMLIVLDNASSAQQVRSLVPGRSGSVVLVTSRHRLAGLVARDGARRLGLEVLSTDEAIALLSRIIGPERVYHDLEASRALAELCGFLPLAVRIAAANLSEQEDLAVGDYVAELRGDDRLAKLAIADDEPSVVRSAFDYSYARLDPAAQGMFRALGLLPFLDFTAAAAATITGSSVAGAGAQLDRLAAAHLLEEGADGRYAFHDLLRVYARELAKARESPDNMVTIVRRACDWLMGNVEAAANLLYPSLARVGATGAGAVQFTQDSPSAMAWLEAEHSNLIATVHHCAEHGPFDVGWRLADSLRGYFALRRHLPDWRSVTTDGLRAADRAREPIGRASVVGGLGHLHFVLTEYQASLSRFQEMLAHSRDAGWLQGELTANTNIAVVYRELGRLDLAEEHVRQNVLLLEGKADISQQARAMGRLGTIRREQGRLREAVQSLQQAVALWRGSGFSGELSFAEDLNSLGYALLTSGCLAEASAALTEALALARRLGAKACESSALDNLACVDLHLGDHSAALEKACAALDLADEISNPRNQADFHHTVAAIRWRMGDGEAARDHLRRAMELAERASFRTALINSLMGSSEVEDSAERALEYAKRAHDLACQTGHRVLAGRALTAIAAVHVRAANPGDAAARAREALAIQRLTGARLDEAATLVVLSQASAGRSRSDHVKRASELLARCGIGGGQIRRLVSGSEG